MTKRELNPDMRCVVGLRWLPMLGCAVAGSIVLGSCTSAVPGDGAATKPYFELSCEQIQAEHGRVSLALAAASGKPSGATQAIELSFPRGGGTARSVDRVLVESDLRHRLEHLLEAHREKSCPGELQSATTAASACALTDEKAVGEREYTSNCAKCHGSTGKGDGWLSGYLRERTPALTQLKKNNAGVFPTERVHAVIDGRKERDVHGPRTMPVWGDSYQAKGNLLDSYLACSTEDAVRVRITALIKHITQFQE